MSPLGPAASSSGRSAGCTLAGGVPPDEVPGSVAKASKAPLPCKDARGERAAAVLCVVVSQSGLRGGDARYFGCSCETKGFACEWWWRRGGGAAAGAAPSDAAR
eukprot:357708-Chlamydomonas_euryale.AAC.1